MSVVLLADRSERDTREPDSCPERSPVCRTHVPLDDSTDVDALARAYLAEPETESFAAMDGRARIPWLLGRVAAKDAVREHLAQRDFAAIDPTRIVVRNDENGRPLVAVRGARLSTRGVQVSIAHKSAVAVAVAARVRRTTMPTSVAPVDKGVGIDIERVEARPTSFAEMILSPSERSLLESSRDDRDAWLTRMWTVKEATAKTTGLGLRGRPKDFEVDAIDDDRLRCCGRWISTAQLGAGSHRYIVAWTDSV